MSIRVCRSLAVLSAFAASTALGAAISDVELKNWPAPMY